MKQLICISFFLLMQVSSDAQGSITLEDKPFYHDPIPEGQLDKLRKRYPILMGKQESVVQMFYWVNLLRTDPPAFYQRQVLPFLAQYPEAGGPEAISLATDLNGTESMATLEPYREAFMVAERHATDLAAHQHKISHVSSRGETFQERVRAAGIQRCAGENISEGRNDVLEALILLLLDNGVPGLGHRKALLDPRFERMGCAVAQRYHTEKFIAVQVFACR